MASLTAAQYRALARRRLPRFLFEYADGGSYDERTMRANADDLTRIHLRQRVLRDVSLIDLSCRLFSETLAFPVVLGPVGIAGIYRRRGEVQAARAASAMGIPFTLSTVSLCSLTEVASATQVAPWFQLYVIRDRAFMLDMLETAESLGTRTLVFTVDMPVPGARRRDARSGMSGPHASTRRVIQSALHPRWLWDVGVRGRPHVLGNLAPMLGKESGLNDYMGWLSRNFDPSVTWADLTWIRERWRGALVIKGVLDPNDARMAADLGADGVVVSNHGGRQLDGVVSSMAALPRIVETVGDKVTVLVDGGVRSGLDVVRMLGLGARGVLLGRAWLFALAAHGETGVASMLTTMVDEMRVAMALTGVASIRDLDVSALES